MDECKFVAYIIFNPAAAEEWFRRKSSSLICLVNKCFNPAKAEEWFRDTLPSWASLGVTGFNPAKAEEWFNKCVTGKEAEYIDAFQSSRSRRMV